MIQDLTENIVYKLNVYAIVYDTNQKEVESKELHEKVELKYTYFITSSLNNSLLQVILSDDDKLMIFSEEDKTSCGGGGEGPGGLGRQFSVQQ